MKKDPDLPDVPKDTIPHVIRTLFVASYTSGIGKTTFMKHLFRYASFITGGKSHPGTLVDTGPESSTLNAGFLAFLRLMGTVYFHFQ